MGLFYSGVRQTLAYIKHFPCRLVKQFTHIIQQERQWVLLRVMGRLLLELAVQL
jgi:hypothetical protein